MKYIAICAKGMEDISQKEIKEILTVDSKIVIPGRIMFESLDIETLKQKTQSIIKLYELKQQCHKLEEIKTFKIGEPFRVICSRKGAHTYTSADVAQQVGKLFYEEGYKVDLEDPRCIVFVDIVEEDIFVGIELTPKLLSKREYRIRTHNQSINACIAYGLVRLSTFDETKTLLDPFAKDGVIGIEAVLFKKGNVFGYDSLFHNVKNVEINSKLANIRKEVNTARIDIEWLDTKFKEGEVDCVVSAVPYPSKHVPENLIKKMYKELFHQLDYILSEKGKIVFIAPKVELLKEMNENLTIVEERNVSTSNLEYTVLIFKK
jgi:23S rRNA G2445 N2-methylase RlmL